MTRLLTIGLLALGSLSISAQAPGAHVMAPLDSLTWRGGANGLSTAIAEGDPSKPGGFTMMLKLADGAWIPPHFHNVDKRLVVIKGELLMGSGDKVEAAAAAPLAVGGVAVVHANTHHFEGGRGETIVALIATGPFTTTYVK
jgi:hypothetical protein